MEHVFSLLSIMPNPQITDVLNGIGIIKSVLNAQKIGSLTLIKFVYQ